MSMKGANVAVVGSGISGAVCASSLARNGISVTLFESAGGPGGRMSQRRFSKYVEVSQANIYLYNDEQHSDEVISHEGLMSKRYVGVPGMNSICKALFREPGVENRFGTSVGRLEWLEDQNLWSLIGSDGQNLKNIVSPRFNVTGRQPPVGRMTFQFGHALL